MNRSMKAVCVPLLMVLLAGCAGVSARITEKSRSERSDVFSEIREDAPPAKGSVDLTVKASVKTHVEGHYLIERPGTRHGAPEYPFVLNIGGQAVTWNVPGRLEDTTTTEAAGSVRAERGQGMRYILSRRIRLRPGPHTVFFALPSEDVAREIAVTLVNGEVTVLEFIPVYRRYGG